MRDTTRTVLKRRLSDQVADTLREMILVGELRGERSITQDELAAELGVSTTPVREALLRLATEGFVRASPNRAFQVVHATPADVRDVYWLHASLSAELTRRACEEISEDGLVHLRSDAQRYADAVAGGDPAAMEKTNWDFHRRINTAAGAPRLQLALGMNLRFIPRGFYGLRPEWREESVHDHTRILAAFEARDPDKAAEAMSAHVNAAAEIMLTFLSASGYWQLPNPGT